MGLAPTLDPLGTQGPLTAVMPDIVNATAALTQHFLQNPTNIGDEYVQQATTRAANTAAQTAQSASRQANEQASVGAGARSGTTQGQQMDIAARQGTEVGNAVLQALMTAPLLQRDQEQQALAAGIGGTQALLRPAEQVLAAQLGNIGQIASASPYSPGAQGAGEGLGALLGAAGGAGGFPTLFGK